MMDALGGIPRKDVLLNEPLGSGTFGTVYRARLGKQLIAAKEMRVVLAAHRNEIIEAARRESKLLMRARHQNVIGLLGVVLDVLAIESNARRLPVSPSVLCGLCPPRRTTMQATPACKPPHAMMRNRVRVWTAGPKPRLPAHGACHRRQPAFVPGLQGRP